MLSSISMYDIFCLSFFYHTFATLSIHHRSTFLNHESSSVLSFFSRNTFVVFDDLNVYHLPGFNQPCGRLQFLTLLTLYFTTAASWVGSFRSLFSNLLISNSIFDQPSLRFSKIIVIWLATLEHQIENS